MCLNDFYCLQSLLLHVYFDDIKNDAKQDKARSAAAEAMYGGV